MSVAAAVCIFIIIIVYNTVFLIVWSIVQMPLLLAYGPVFKCLVLSNQESKSKDNQFRIIFYILNSGKTANPHFWEAQPKERWQWISCCCWFIFCLLTNLIHCFSSSCEVNCSPSLVLISALVLRYLFPITSRKIQVYLQVNEKGSERSHPFCCYSYVMYCVNIWSTSSAANLAHILVLNIKYL